MKLNRRQLNRLLIKIACSMTTTEDAIALARHLAIPMPKLVAVNTVGLGK